MRTRGHTPPDMASGGVSTYRTLCPVACLLPGLQVREKRAVGECGMNGEVSVFDQLLNILGKDAMRRFLSAFGGRDFKFPKTTQSPTAQAIASVVGEEKAAELIDAFCGGQVYVPKHPDAVDRDAPYLRLMADGLTNTEISYRLGVAERSVRRALARCGVKNPNNDPGNARKRAARQLA